MRRLIVTLLLSGLLACSKEAPHGDSGTEPPATKAAPSAVASAPPAPPLVSHEINFHRSVMTTPGDELDVCADTDVKVIAPEGGQATDPTPTEPKAVDEKKLPKLEGDAGLEWLSDPKNLQVVLSDDVAGWMAGDRTVTEERLSKLPDGTKRAPAIGRLTRLREKNTTPVPTTCTATLKDRVVLATCSIEVALPAADPGKIAEVVKKNPGSAPFLQLMATPMTLKVSARYYNFGTVGLSDKPMTDCLALKGSWNALDRDSREWARAKLHHDSRKLRRAVESQTQTQ